MSKEAMTKAIEALKKCHYYMIDAGLPNQSMLIDVFAAYKALEAAMAEQPAQTLPFGVGGGLVAIKTLLSRDPCVHANTAIQMIEAILAEQPAQQEPATKDVVIDNMGKPFTVKAYVTPQPAQQEPAKCSQAIIHAITMYGDARAYQDANNAPKTSHERLADCIRLVREALAEQPAPVQPTALSIYEAIKHGDAKHQEWLRSALENIFAGLEVPREPEQPAQQESESNKAAYQRGYLDGMAKPCIECADRHPKQEQNMNITVAGVVLRDGQPTLLQDKHIKATDERLFRAAHGIKENT